ncbi:MAG TPA: carboxypeptidase regulatory-like domain-containing protein [Vicinamibacterales bacterium]|nr:carboxypeptidase regulatory-like domain-containing protein [Vicinamibacterales bacterium]
MLSLVASAASARQTTSSITGVVQDSAGGVVPGAAVVVLSPNGTKFEVVSNSSGAFNVPALLPGVYSVTVSLQGFKTAVVKDVRIQPGVPANLKVTLEIGGITEKVTVSGGSSELVNTRTATVSSTLNVDQIAQLPTATRDLLLGGVTMLTGVNFTGAARGNATVNGLPESFLNITLDGVTNNDNFNKSTDGFFAPVRPRQDAIEAVVVTTAAGAADQGGHGAVTINFVTRSGTNRFSGSAYEYYRDTWMNTNYWFNENRDNLARNDVRLNQFGNRIGGPIIIPGLYDGSGKAFFFYHHEMLRLPNDASRTRTILHPRALQGFFRYNSTVNGQVITQEVNVLTLGAPFSTPDPTVMAVLNGIQAAVQKTGTVANTSDPMNLSYSWRSPAMQSEHQPAIRIDYNLTPKHRLSGTFNKLFQDRKPDQFNDLDQRFPAAPNFSHTVARRPSRSITLRSTLSQSLVSEFRVGITVGETIYFGQVATGGPDSFADQGGRALTLGIGQTNWHTSNTLSGRSAGAWSFDESMNWQRGKHVLTFGGQVFLGRFWDVSQMQVPGITFALDQTNDPANAIISNTSNYPNNPGLGNARALFALLTGRVASITGQAALNGLTNQYEFLGNRRRGGKLNNYAMFLQDSWRVKPTVTLNAGLRWDVQTPFASNNDIFSSVTLADLCGVSGLGDGSIYRACRFFTPAASGGKVPVYSQLVRGTNGYNTDLNNLSPNVNVAWRPNVQSGFLRTLLGDPEQATLTGGFSVQFERQGFGAFTGVYGGNPGSTLTLNRNANSGLVPAGESWPILLSQSSRLGPASFPVSPVYPIALRANRQDSISGFHPDIQVASARSWTVGLQRAVSKDMAVSIRYVGTKGVDQWQTLNYNERNVIDNGFYNEFKVAMSNFQAHLAQGCGQTGNPACTFAYRGPGTGSNPLPIYLAYLSGKTGADQCSSTATCATLYSGTGWTNSGLLGRFIRLNPSPSGSAGDLDGDSTRRANAIAAGLAANFFVVNPDANAVNVTDSGAYSDYHALQLEVRRRLSKGLSANVSYQYAREGSAAFLGFHYGRQMDPSDNSPRHAIKGQWDWTLPVGRGQRYGSDMNPILDGVLGGWSFTGSARIQARMIDFGNVRMVGMTAKDVQSWFKYRIIEDPNNAGRKLVLMAPDDVILNTRRAFSFSTATLTGYSGLGEPTGAYFAPQQSSTCIELKIGGGDCGPRTLLIRAPFFTRVDIGMTKRFKMTSTRNIEIRVDVLNLFDNINFNPNGNPGGGATIFQVGSAYTDIGNNFDPGGRLGQFSVRFNW